ncbi:MAG: lysine--tRNA ligase [Crocinitomicaceae bacterium]|nr:lysine--tRNA ligase [Crocinitomicaceae bacterium]
MSHIELSEQEIQRRESLTKLRAMGIDPFPAALYPVTDYSAKIKQKYEEGKEVCIAGRMMSRRIMGKASFAELLDSSGRIQVYLNRDELCPGEDKTIYNDVFKRLLDLGDFIGIRGKVFKTKVGEVSIHVTEITILSKSVKPLPIAKTDDEGVVHDAFTDPELRYRQRYVDLVVNPHVKDVFLKRTKLFTAMRNFFNDAGYLEVETPILQPIAGGAAARPFMTHHNALDVPLYMRIANELYLKRLIVGGFDGVYEFSKNFRNEGMDRTHNPEFTAMEIYVSYKDYNWMMDFCERLLEHCATAVNGTSIATFGEYKIDFKAPYKRVTMRQSIIDFTGYDIKGQTEDQLRTEARKMGFQVDETMGVGKLIDEIFGEKCEGNYIQPTFITDYPKEMSPLCKEHREDPSLTERFELMVCGKEIANAYSELNDPIDQRERFEEQVKLAAKGDDEAGEFIDQDFLRSLEYGMPPTSGMGIGMDRLIMYLTNNPSIQEVLFFPQMKSENWGEPAGPELNDNEKAVLALVEKEHLIELNALKEQSGLSNKQWDKSIKGLRNHGLIDVTKAEDTLTVTLVN